MITLAQGKPYHETINQGLLQPQAELHYSAIIF